MIEREIAITVVVAQLAEHKVVVLGVAGSSPVDHPFQNYFNSDLRAASCTIWGSISPLRPRSDQWARDE